MNFFILSPHIKMQVLTLVFGLSAILVTVNAGGYTAKGGVFDFKKPLDYYDSAVNAGTESKTIEDGIMHCLFAERIGQKFI